MSARAKAGGIDLDKAIAAARKRACRPDGSAMPAEFGATCAFLCSAHASFIVGQNILIDGGAYPGTF